MAPNNQPKEDWDYEKLKYDGWKQEQIAITFAGGTTNAIGDHDGTSDPFTMFNVDGTVRMKIVGICTTILAGASATVEVGVTGKTAGLIAQTTATDIDANDIWHDATTPDSPIELESVMLDVIVANGLDVLLTVGTANITSGAITFICLWKPISNDGKVKAVAASA